MGWGAGGGRGGGRGGRRGASAVKKKKKDEWDPLEAITNKDMHPGDSLVQGKQKIKSIEAEQS